MGNIQLTVDSKAMAILLDYLKNELEDWKYGHSDKEWKKSHAPNDRAILNAYNKVSKAFLSCFGTNVKPTIS